jgi:3-oxoacyl-(acyl-carrier-protein) synthase
MKTIINNVELLDANGTSYSNCIENYLRGNSINVTRHEHAPLIGLPKFDIPLTDEELDLELDKINYLESDMPRAIKLAVLAAGRCAAGIELPKNTPVIGVTLQGSQETASKVWRALFAEKRMISPRWGATVSQSSICTTISRYLGLTGPSFMINQACSAFITAFDIAEKFLNSNQCITNWSDDQKIKIIVAYFIPS